MNERRLTSEQIDDLFAFCEEQNVHYYDLQIELVDHLSAGIERVWNEDPTVSFTDALNILFEQFGNKGFREIIKEKTKSLKRKYKRLQLNLIGQYFTSFKIIIPICIALVVFSCFSFLNNDKLILTIIFIGSLPIIIIHQIAFTRKYSTFKLKHSERFLLADIMSASARGIGYLCGLPWVLYTYIDGTLSSSSLTLENNIYSELAITLLITLATIALIVFIVDIPKQIKHEYPNLLKPKRT